MNVAERQSPLRRGSWDEDLVEGKIRNVSLAAEKLDGLLLGPDEIFSFCRIVGKTTRRCGFTEGPELHDGKMGAAVGGGVCQISNLLFLLALDINADILERHRHSFDLMPDVNRTVPFGCGATVFYNYVDFQFRNVLPRPVLLEMKLTQGHLVGRFSSTEPLGFRVSIVETGHRFFRRDEKTYRANKLWKVVDRGDGREAAPEFLFGNESHVLYPTDHLEL